ncbi:hypothetical protein [Stieleria neptunia]|uniref:hypothetical protein n=1 Tax=Stieleria neptunia TaxID=2527979 RepID=UPI00119CECAF|nr:hypothetical protein [Stieleria neptunia]
MYLLLFRMRSFKVSFRKIVYIALLSAFTVSLWNLASTASAAPPAGVPEIDPSSAACALAVLSGCGLMVAERLGLRRK